MYFELNGFFLIFLILFLRHNHGKHTAHIHLPDPWLFPAKGQRFSAIQLQNAEPVRDLCIASGHGFVLYSENSDQLATPISTRNRMDWFLHLIRVFLGNGQVVRLVAQTHRLPDSHRRFGKHFIRRIPNHTGTIWRKRPRNGYRRRPARNFRRHGHFRDPDRNGFLQRQTRSKSHRQ